MIREPMTLATDYLMAIFAVGFAVRLILIRNHLWGAAFFYTAVASMAGGTYHGFGHTMESSTAVVLWKITVYSIGLASLFLLLGAPAADPVRPIIRIVAVVKFIAYAFWMATHDSFMYVIVDYGSSLLILGALAVAGWIRGRAPASPWILGSIGVSIVAAAIQQSGVAFHRHFNHNDLYHLVQIVGLWMLYRGGRLMIPSTPALSPVAGVRGTPPES